jgi:hypothetical protein
MGNFATGSRGISTDNAPEGIWVALAGHPVSKDQHHHRRAGALQRHRVHRLERHAGTERARRGHRLQPGNAQGAAASVSIVASASAGIADAAPRRSGACPHRGRQPRLGRASPAGECTSTGRTCAFTVRATACSLLTCHQCRRLYTPLWSGPEPWPISRSTHSPPTPGRLSPRRRT